MFALRTSAAGSASSGSRAKGFGALNSAVATSVEAALVDDGGEDIVVASDRNSDRGGSGDERSEEGSRVHFQMM